MTAHSQNDRAQWLSPDSLIENNCGVDWRPNSCSRQRRRCDRSPCTPSIGWSWWARAWCCRGRLDGPSLWRQQRSRWWCCLSDERESVERQLWWVLREGDERGGGEGDESGCWERVLIEGMESGCEIMSIKKLYDKRNCSTKWVGCTCRKYEYGHTSLQLHPWRTPERDTFPPRSRGN